MAVIFTGEPSQYRRPDDPVEITGYVELLQVLEVFDPSVEPHSPPTQMQRVAVAEWLRVNEPGDLLAYDLRSHGVEVAAGATASR